MKGYGGGILAELLTKAITGRGCEVCRACLLEYGDHGLGRIPVQGAGYQDMWII